ncbi:hypothetical protein BgiMline_033335 [Biomphalaria glabrata]
MAMQFIGPQDGHAVHWTTRWPCSSLDHKMAMQFIGPQDGHAVHWTTRWPCSSLDRKMAMQFIRQDSHAAHQTR